MARVNKKQQALERELMEAAKGHTAARKRRDATIRRAVKAGMPMRAIGRAVGLSAARVQRISIGE
jgi:hypothetical protein